MKAKKEKLTAQQRYLLERIHDGVQCQSYTDFRVSGARDFIQLRESDGDLFCTQTANSLLKRGYLEKTGLYFDMFRDLRLTEKGKNFLKDEEPQKCFPTQQA